MRIAAVLAAGVATVAAASALSIGSAAAPLSTPAEPLPAAPAPQRVASIPVEPVAHTTQPAADSESVRFTGKIGADLTRSLQAAGVPEAQGREYVAAIARAIPLQDGLSVDDKFDLVLLRENGRLGALAYAGLDRVARSDVELMKWTDGKETRWINADGVDASSQGVSMPVAGRVSSGFGARFHPILGYRRMHAGVDLAAPYGTPIAAAADGRVVLAGWSGGYGREVAIAHEGGLQTKYGHMSRIAAAVGQYVRRGQVIGYVGSTGLSTGPHLHYEARLNGRLVNPLSVKLAASPLQEKELHAFRSKLRGLLMGRTAG